MFLKDLYELVMSRMTCRKGMYVGYWLDSSEIGTVGNLAKGDIILRPIDFSDDDKIEVFPSIIRTGEKNFEAPLLEPFVIDPIRNVVYLLATRLYGGQDGCSNYSLLDQKICEKHGRKNINKVIGYLMGIKFMEYGCDKGNFNKKLGDSVSYKDIPVNGKQSILEEFNQSLKAIKYKYTMSSKDYQKKWFAYFGEAF